jgi:hypothetical protein
MDPANAISRTTTVDRDALTGVVVAGGFGAGWSWWAASGLSGDAAVAIRFGGTAVAALLVAGALVRYPVAAATGHDSIFRSQGYLVVVAAEVIALFGGNAVLGGAGDGRYVAAWTAFVVGVHFIGFGRLFAAMFYRLGAGFIVAAVAGLIIGAATGTRADVESATGLIAANSLFVAGGWGLRAQSRKIDTAIR